METASQEVRGANIDDNGNTTKGAGGCFELIKTLLKIVVCMILLYVVVDACYSAWIDSATDEELYAIEDAFAGGEDAYKKFIIDSPETIKKAEKLADEVAAFDKNLPRKRLKFFVINKEGMINAFTLSNGHIYITKGLLDVLKNDEEFDFVLAHEMGHYRYRHVVKKVSGNIFVRLSSWIFPDSFSIKRISNFIVNKYSRSEEIEADTYGVEFLKYKYKSTDGAKSVLKKFEELGGVPDFIYSFTDHPSTRNRLKGSHALE